MDFLLGGGETLSGELFSAPRPSPGQVRAGDKSSWTWPRWFEVGVLGLRRCPRKPANASGVASLGRSIGVYRFFYPLHEAQEVDVLLLRFF